MQYRACKNFCFQIQVFNLITFFLQLVVKFFVDVDFLKEAECDNAFSCIQKMLM